ncbi:MAG: hypothetical protein FWC68_06375 [Oscillospiraceae bacterium]|nr:hypothetical protein [Oscillospiraceae bacterium]
MHEIQRLKKLLSEMEKGELFQKELNEHRYIHEEKKNNLGYYALIPNVVSRGFVFTAPLGKVIFFTGLANALIYLIMPIVSLVFRFLGAVFGWNAENIRRTFTNLLYYLGFPAIEGSRLIASLTRIEFLQPFTEVEFNPERPHFTDVYVYGGIVVVVLTIIAALIIIDIIFILIRNPTVGVRNRRIQHKNELIQIENTRTFEEWKNTTEYSTAISTMEVIEQEIYKCNERINANGVLHNDYKTLRIVRRLIYYLESKEARDLTEAIQWMHTIDHQERLEEIEMEELRERQRQTDAAERAEKISRQAAYNAGVAADEAARAVDIAKATAWVTAINILFDD